MASQLFNYFIVWLNYINLIDIIKFIKNTVIIVKAQNVFYLVFYFSKT